MTLYHQILTDNDEVDIVVDYNPQDDSIEIIEICFNKVDYTETLDHLSSLKFVYEIDWQSIYKENKQQFEYDQWKNS